MHFAWHFSARFQRKVCRFSEACINCLLLTATLFLGPLVVQPNKEERCVVVANHMPKWMQNWDVVGSSPFYDMSF